MYPDFEALLSALNDHDVKYLVVGGYAVSKHAQPRATQDLDIFVEATQRNADRLFAALQAFGAPLSGYVASDLVAKGSFFRMGHAPVAIDILTEIDGVPFKRAWKSRVAAVVNSKTGLKAHFISLEDLIENKLASARSRDIADVDELRAAKRKERASAGRKRRAATHPAKRVSRKPD